MQNKNRVLRRGGFAVIAAVFMMLLITLMLLKMLSYSTDVASRTSNNYLNEQAQLLAFNATEDAVYRISGINPYTTACITSQDYTYASMLDVNITIRYIWSNGLTPATATCQNYIDATQAFTLDSNISNGAALIDVYVSSTPSLGLDEPIRFHRRTLQKL
ncbi:MAG: hypothetical protein P8Y51_05255 [Campylobacterales bacterium]|jgi:hypothetical protein